ncbi:MAG: lysylphosphatidylglycerol synthase transmembrane domain-containing protein [Rhodobacterales bacterium]
MKGSVLISRKAGLKLLRIAVALGLLGLLWQTVDGPAALDLLLRADLVWLLAAVMALTTQTFFSALRWRLTAGALGQVIAVRHAVREYYLSQIINQSFPGGVLGDAARALRARHGAGLKRAGQAVIFERLAGQMALLAVTISAITLVWLFPGRIVLPGWVLNGVAVALLALGLAGGMIWAISRGSSTVAQHMRDWTQDFATAVLSRKVLPSQIMLSLGTTVMNLLAFALCAKATGTALPLTSIMIIVPLILFTMLIPITVSGWGLREGAAAALFPLIGATATEGFAASLAFGLVFLASVLPALPFVLLQPAGGAGPLAAQPSAQGNSAAGMIPKNAPSDQMPNQLTPSTSFSAPNSTSR